ncbi:MAG: hypothetical protein SF172_15095 [Burkholderiales bacterium]|nr:hypothetical protein [Burkholderiales bacterium]
MRPAKLNVATVREWFRRQPTDRFSPSYEPAIRATREEAPRKSIPCRFQCRKLGREVHALSQAELQFALIALYHPDLWELQEQRILSMVPAPHPLFSHQKAGGRHLPSLPGTMAILDELDMLGRQPKLIERDATGKLNMVPVPWVGDLLLFLQDDAGPYLVNWSIKSTPDEFLVPRNLDPTRGPPRKAPKQRLRHDVEVLHYQRADIPTRELAPVKDLHQLLGSLTLIYAGNERCPELPEKTRRRLLSQFQLALRNHIPPVELFMLPTIRQIADEATLRNVLFSSIWRRELRVELTQPIHIDEPLIAEQTDLLDRFRTGFSRGPK